MRDEVFDMMTWWFEKGIDGFRMDVISQISKDQRFPDGEQYGLYGNGGRYFTDGPRVQRFCQAFSLSLSAFYCPPASLHKKLSRRYCYCRESSSYAAHTGINRPAPLFRLQAHRHAAYMPMANSGKKPGQLLLKRVK